MAVTESKGDGYALYNGVKLPNIDTVWTEELKQTHPYAVITYYSESTSLLLTNVVVKNGENLLAVSTVDGNGCMYDLIDDSWKLYAEAPIIAGTPIGSSSAIAWSSYDIHNTDSTVYLAASDPIPLDGMNVIEWDGVTEELEKVYTICRLADYQKAKNALLTVRNSAGSYVVADDFEFYEEDDVGPERWSIDLPNGTNVVAAMKSDIDHFSAGIWCDATGGEDVLIVIAYTPATTEKPDKNKISPQLAFIIGKQLGRRILMATKPVDVPTTPEPPIPEGPTAYCLYNGVKLPNIDIVWTDKETYPYAYITASTLAPAGGTGNLYAVYLSDTSAVWDSEESGLRFFKGTYLRGLACVTEQSDADNLESVLGLSIPVNSWGVQEVDSPLGEEVTYLGGDMVWVNTDILTTDSTVYLAASDPVPVYE